MAQLTIVSKLKIWGKSVMLKSNIQVFIFLEFSSNSHYICPQWQSSTKNHRFSIFLCDMLPEKTGKFIVFEKEKQFICRNHPPGIS